MALVLVVFVPSDKSARLLLLLVRLVLLVELQLQQVLLVAVVVFVFILLLVNVVLVLVVHHLLLSCIIIIFNLSPPILWFIVEYMFLVLPSSILLQFPSSFIFLRRCLVCFMMSLV